MIQQLLKQAQSHIGVQQGDSRHKQLIKQYNGVKPLPVGYPMKESDDWCAAFVTVMGDLTNTSKYFGRECGVHRFVQEFKKRKIWLGKEKPQTGDLIVFDWRKNGWMDHIGLVEQFVGNKVTAIEGNTSRRVARRTYNWNDWRIAGYARPKYPIITNNGTAGKKSNHDLAREVIAGKWGNGQKRKDALTHAGYNPHAIQKEVNKQLITQSNQLKSNKTIAQEVTLGKWGNGKERKKRLEDAGYHYQTIQKIVNQL